MYPQQSIPCYGEPPLPWRHLLMSAARGSPRLGPWVLGALIGCLEAALDVAPEDCEEADIERFFERLPAEYPGRRLRPLLRAFEQRLDAEPRNPPERYQGILLRGEIDQADLLHDAILELRSRWSLAHGRGLIDAHDPDAGGDYDARDAVMSLLYIWTALECGPRAGGSF